jgi:predicted PurR-regulated permease PerM
MERGFGSDPELSRPAALRGSLQNAFYAVALVVMLGWILYVGRGIIVPFVMALIVVYVVIGLAGLLESIPVVGLRIPRWARNMIAIVVIALVLWQIFALMIIDATQVAAVVPRYESRLLGIIQSITVRLGMEEEPTWTTIRDQVLGQIELGQLIGSTVSSISQIVGIAAVVVLYAAFLLAEWAIFGSKLGRISRDPETVAGVRAVLAQINDRIGQYLALKTLVNFILGLASYAMMAVVGVEFAAFWAILIGFLNYIPYLGSFLGVLFPVVLSALQFDPQTVIVVLLVLTAAQTFVGSFVEPYVMGNSLNLSPTAILLSLAAWSALWGIPGAILSVPITASILIVLASFEATRPVAVMLSRNGEVADPIAPVRGEGAR